MQLNGSHETFAQSRLDEGATYYFFLVLVAQAAKTIRHKSLVPTFRRHLHCHLLATLSELTTLTGSEHISVRLALGDLAGIGIDALVESLHLVSAGTLRLSRRRRLSWGVRTANWPHHGTDRAVSECAASSHRGTCTRQSVQMVYFTKHLGTMCLGFYGGNGWTLVDSP